MLPYFILGIGLLIGLLLIGRWYVSADPRQLARLLKWLAIVLLGGAALFLTVTGRIWLAMVLATTLVPLAMRLMRSARMAKNYARMAGVNAQDGGTSTIETGLLRMVLDHDSGELDGEVISGPYAGRTLQTLSLAEVIDLLQYSKIHDAQSVQILEAYLDRTHSNWRDQAHAGQAGKQGENSSNDIPGAAMTEAEAYRILGIGPGATADDVRSAHHRLISLLHPDRGGSSFLAAQVNRARDLLLNEHHRQSRRS